MYKKNNEEKKIFLTIQTIAIQARQQNHLCVCWRASSEATGAFERREKINIYVENPNEGDKARNVSWRMKCGEQSRKWEINFTI